MPAHTNTRIELVVAFALVSPMQGCRFTEPNTAHCNYNDGDAYCARQYPDGSRPFCEQGFAPCVSVESEYGCVQDRPDDACYSPCGGDSTLAVDDSCLIGVSSSSTTEPGIEESSESGSESTSSTTGPMPCVGNEDCPDAQAPFCELASGECVACDAVDDPDGSCSAEDSSMPVCVGGVCVQCTAVAPEACIGTTPVCDDATNTCVACTEHGQCGDAACNLFNGACLPADAVVRVGPGLDYGTLGEAIGTFGPGAEGTIIVHQDDYNEAAVVDGGRTLAFLANEGDLPRWILSGGGSPQLTVSDGTALMDGIQVSGNASTMDPGLLVDGGRAWVDRGRIINNDGGGIVAQNAAELVVRNCFVGGSVDDADALAVNGATASVVYTTLAAGTVTVAGLSCSRPTAVDVRNSVIVARGIDATGAFDIVCAEATVTYSATESMVDGDGNVSLGELPTTMPEDWFSNYGAGDFHLTTPPITIGTTAQWQDGDLATDIDGEDRPSVDGLSDFAGADVP
ncbi:MAG: hypothetical protein AAGF11_43650 [Myxococcota bacterium]